jgi:pantoate--beta-alanine ligase
MTRPVVAESVADLRKLRADLPGPVALVPTMGALHEGHRALIRAARARAGSVVVSVFVNPTQFGPGEDFDRYPRAWDADLAALAEEGADLVFHPGVEQIYPAGALGVTVQPGPVGGILEGAIRPGHFAGVLTVVATLFGLVRPDLALFGEKDYQQLTLIREMVCDLDMDVDIVPVPTVREPDGLAMSSRNRYLSETERDEALVLYRALSAGAKAGMNGPDAVLAAAQAELEAVPSVRIDYLALRAPDLGPVIGPGEARMLIAARVGLTRLIDNISITLR